jgi:hypothetical protein
MQWLNLHGKVRTELGTKISVDFTNPLQQKLTDKRKLSFSFVPRNPEVL